MNQKTSRTDFGSVLAKRQRFDSEPNLLGIVQNDDLDGFQEVAKEQDTVNLKCSAGTALYLCVRHKSRRIFDFLMEAPDFQIEFNCGPHDDTALILIVERSGEWDVSRKTGEPSLYKYFMSRLLEKGANPYQENSLGLTALMLACEKGHNDCIRLLLSVEGSIEIGSGRQFRHPFDVASESSLCSEDTLELLFHRSFDQKTTKKLHINTIGHLIRNKHIDLLEKILRCVSEVVISSQYDLTCFVTKLNQLPFRVFEEMTCRFPTVLGKFQQVKFRNLFETMRLGPDFAKYVQFLCENCRDIGTFFATWLLIQPTKVSEEVLSEVLLTMFDNKVPVEIDMHLFYRMYDFSPLFEKLLSSDVMHVRFGLPSRTDFAAVHYNMTLDVTRHLNGKEKYGDYHSYFADNGQVPSLLELSRETIRKTVIKENIIRKYCQYVKALEKLGLCQFLIDILIFKRKIY